MRTLRELIVAARCRKGEPAGIDAAGEWWQAGPTVKSARSGGDGIGNSAPSVRCDLQMRHYRTGSVVVGVLVERWHQNVGTRSEWVPMPGIEAAETAADAERLLALAAAAPELLAALEWIVDDWERAIQRTLPDDHEAKAAIAKAKGGAL